MKETRRSLLRRSAAGVAGAAVAGCIEGPETREREGRHGYAAFFTLYDWTREIAGDRIDVETPVAAGQMGHGWEPDFGITRDVADSDVFVYLDTPEFAWAQDVVRDLERDHPDVHVVDGLQGFTSKDLLALGGDPAREPAYDHSFDPTSLEIGGFDVVGRRSGEVAAYWHDGHWHGGVPDVSVDGYTDVDGVFEDIEGRVVPLDESQGFTFDAEVTGPDGVVEVESQGDSVRIHGIDTGRTFLVFQLKHDGEVIWDTGADDVTVEVVEELEPVEAGEFHDPHVWVDPVLAEQVVDTIADELAEVDPDGAETYLENAEAYRERMQMVHEEFTAIAEDAERDLVMFAGHDSFQYLEERYGFEIHTPVGVTPDAAESFEDVTGMVDVVEEHDVHTVLYDPFEGPTGEPPQMVDFILENSTATDHAPLTPAEGTTREWQEDGWGWVEQMLEVNAPSLRQALDAD